MRCAVPSDCSGYPHNCPTATPDPDVAGIGVVWSFGLTSLITVLLASPIMLVGLADFLQARKLPFERLAGLLFLNTPGRRKKWNDVLVHLTLGLSDQQLVTGLAILVVGFTNHCTIASRHFWVVFDLAWFSSVTHLASLPALTRYLREHPRWRDLRVLLMLLNYAMLVGAAVLSFGNYDPKSHDCPIQCAFDRYNTGTFPISQIHVAQMVFLALSFIWALVQLFTPERAWEARHEIVVKHRTWGDDAEVLAKLIEEEENDLGESILTIPQRKFWQVASRIHKRWRDNKIYIVCFTLSLFVWAPPAALKWGVLSGMWGMGVARLLSDRQWAVEAENTWAFGQTLPLLLLVLPFFTMFEVMQEEVIMPRRHRSSTSTKLVDLTPYDARTGVPSHLESIPLDDTTARASSHAPTQDGLAFPSPTLPSSSLQSSGTSYRPTSTQSTLPGRSLVASQPADLPPPGSAAQTYQSLPQDEPTKD